MDIDFEQLKELLEIVSQNDISELTVESGEECITVKKPPAPHMVAHMSALPVHVPGMPIPMPGHHLPSPDHEHPHAGPNGAAGTPQPAVAPPTPEPAKDNFLKITSPMVGTFYRSASPSKPPFVEIGDAVTVGQTVCIIEAMKLMNDLPSEVSGRIVEILASNGATVEYGQALFLIDPGSGQ
jgi:acetyl-CoA carboxylase biotin carboxyl carrier protein